MKKKRIIIITMILVAVLLLGGTTWFFLKSNLEKKEDIIAFEFSSSNNYHNGDYYIDTEEELNYFYSLYTSELKLPKEELSNHTFFIKVEKGTDKTEKKITEVKTDQNQIEFIVTEKNNETEKEQEITWFLIAIVPNTIANKMDKTNYKKPSEILFQTEPEIKDYTFKLDSNKKYEIITDQKYLTMQNDGGSHTNVYYQLDFEEAIVVKKEENYHANLGGTPTTDSKTIYTTLIPADLSEELQKTISDILDKEDEDDGTNYEPYTIKTQNEEKEIYNYDTIDLLKELLDELDDLE